MVVAVILGIVLGIVAAPVRVVDADALARFERLQHHIGRDVVLVDGTGIVLEGRLLAARDNALDLGFGARVRHLAAIDVARVDRYPDSSIDGLVKGMVIGALLGGLSRDVGWTLRSAAMYGGIGYFLDARNQSRETIYRAPPAGIQMAATIRW